MTKGHVFSTGNEVLFGDTVDTNSAFLCRQLKRSGVTVIKTSAVRDDMTALVSEIKNIASAADVCVMTGGLGPTSDDLTAEALAKAARVKIKLDTAALSSMKKYFDKRGVPLIPANEKQAMLPEGAQFMENRHGTAPGFSMIIGNCRFFCMPGVPREMERMFDLKVRPQLNEITGQAGEIQVMRLMVFGMPESRVEKALSGFSVQFPGIHLGSRIRFPMIEVRLSRLKEVVSDSQKGLDGATEMNQAKQWVMEKIGPKVISDQGLTLAQEVGRLLTERGQTLSVAESCTGGLVAHLITDVPGASDYFLFSATTYANSAKEAILNVSRETLENNGAVDETTALEMATGVRAAGGSDWAVSTTGIAGPTGGSEDKPVGTVCIGVAGPLESYSQRFLLDRGDRERNKQLFAAMALEMLRKELVKK
ncbi:damage-inducible protein CinA [Desulfobacter hydrogenophilus]|uniref:CinA-like protein n=1 Tax=Desulfobacter hydrogenophilus TaxID=2291 RepID=A0A328FE61_9BACT|nr:CinA family nicotinamide mononucleotide deamidase-related protein [Desulfobacter hydrogenophilus]NDY72105.1 CinA family nicotinamide mononucleotide deamidase-related protein [Desulfobacter hydrogenophilus]QBH14830.1 CinA family nicotinamide mononucleotide deamidase-related protein [Desulfobacter hydrogenophilus]RAM01337.1 damage-inducible protein CinA [Desulfobacter hydrogenophilus]